VTHIGKAAQRTVRRVEGSRLVYYRAGADANFWDRHWQAALTPMVYDDARRGRLGFFESIFARHLPRPGRILEAGCGLGQVVLALRVRGYDCEGVEWGQETVDRVRACWPDLPVRAGDVLHLDVPDRYYQGYVSLGVVEHRQAGPEPFWHEAWRVLADDGVMLVSVPHFHALRRVKAMLGLYHGAANGLGFYQQAFRVAELSRLLQRCGFAVEAVYGYDPHKGLKDDVPLALRLFGLPGAGRRLERLWTRSAWARRYFGHMILFVCRKAKASV
jgi:SAM-dependent methyltransferase